MLLANQENNLRFSPNNVQILRRQCCLNNVQKHVLLAEFTDLHSNHVLNISLDIRSRQKRKRFAWNVLYSDFLLRFPFSTQQLNQHQIHSDPPLHRRRMEETFHRVVYASSSSSLETFLWNNATPPLPWPPPPSPTTLTRTATPSSSRGPPPTSSQLIIPVQREPAQRRETLSLPISSTRSKRDSAAIRWLLTQYQGDCAFSPRTSESRSILAVWQICRACDV